MTRPTKRRDPRQPLTLATLRAAGEPDYLVRRRDFRRVYRGVWVHRSGVDEDTPVRAALALHGGEAWASRTTAAQMLGLPVPRQPFVHVTVPHAHLRRPRMGLKSHVTQRPRGLTKVRGMTCTDPVTTFIECAGMLSLVDLVVLGDALVEKFAVSPEDLLCRCRESRDYYAGPARAAADLVRKGVDSPQETRTRLLLVLGGLPEPVVNFVVRDDDGNVVRRYDMYYPEAGLLVEYDGRQHARDNKQWKGDLGRREELDDLGRRLLIVTYEDLYGAPASVLRRVRRILLLRGVKLPPPDERWRDHFAA